MKTCFISLVFLMISLAACNPGPAGITAAPTEVDINPISTQAAMTAVAQMTQTAALTTTRTPPPTTTPLPSITLEGLRMAYIVDGNIYLQDGSNPPIQLTKSGEDRDPIFSEDGKKIIFYRGKINNNAYSVNPDGGQEQALITNDWLTALGSGTMAGSLTFVPGTHQLLFKTYLCEVTGGPYAIPACEISLYLVNTDTGKIKGPLASGLNGDLRITPFSVSPDGKFLSVATLEHLDILSIEGQVIRRNIMIYFPTESGKVFPRQYWLPDSSGLIVALPIGPYNDPTQPINYTVWRYTLDQNKATQIPLDPSPMESWCGLLVSPDRNRVVYETLGAQLYLGNLKDGDTKLYDYSACSHSWSPSSGYFVYAQGPNDEFFLGAVDELPVSIGYINVLGWVDANHYIYNSSPYRGKEKKKILVGEIVNEKTILNYDSGVSLSEKLNGFTFVVLDK